MSTLSNNSSKMAIMAILETWRKLIDEYRNGILSVVFTAGMFTYLILGAVLFLVLEAPQESVAAKNIIDVKMKVMTKYPTVPGEAIDDMLHGLSSAGVKGVVMNNSTTKWTLGNAIFFCATLLTTIGYGHLSPSTVTGKVLCMVYTAVGIPLTLLLLAMYVDRLMVFSQRYKTVLFDRLGQHLQPQIVRSMHYSTVMSMIITGCFVVPAWIFTGLEISWSYMDALYFCFISLTTVGLGDFVPGLEVGHPHVDLYRFGATLYIFCGVTVMMFMMALTADFVHNFNSPYQAILPVVVAKEDIPIVNATVLPTYGTLGVHSIKPMESTVPEP